MEGIRLSGSSHIERKRLIVRDPGALGIVAVLAISGSDRPAQSASDSRPSDSLPANPSVDRKMWSSVVDSAARNKYPPGA
jgi:hypothetical protein